jgi:hypothetical protein
MSNACFGVLVVLGSLLACLIWQITSMLKRKRAPRALTDADIKGVVREQAIFAPGIY